MSTSPAPQPFDLIARIRALSERSMRTLRHLGVAPADVPLDLHIAGRVLLHSGLVGLVAGALGAAFSCAAIPDAEMDQLFPSDDSGRRESARESLHSETQKIIRDPFLP